jgi:hypothetical protein
MSKDDKYDMLISVLGWEDRFIKGAKNTIDKYDFERILLFKYCHYEEFTNANFNKLKHYCRDEIDLNIVEFKDDIPVNKWNQIRQYFVDNNLIYKRVLLDITTMPRDVIWTVLYFLLLKKNDKTTIDFIYHKPKKYSKTWLTKVPGEPRMLFKHSGITKLGLPTALLILTGFDIERVKQLVYKYEPKVIILGIQTGKQYGNNERNIKLNNQLIEIFKDYSNIEKFNIDAYSHNNGLEDIEDAIISLNNEYNIIAASFGPKPSAISLYKCFKNNENMALTYVPSKNISKNYSKGFKNSLFGNVI